MSFLYDPRAKRPQIWTYPVFIFLPVVILLSFYYFGMKKAAEHPVSVVNAEVERTF
jgi:hypothetical protein